MYLNSHGSYCKVTSEIRMLLLWIFVDKLIASDQALKLSQKSLLELFEERKSLFPPLPLTALLTVLSFL